MQPEVPALYARPEEEELQTHVSVEFDFVKEQPERADAHDARRPCPDVLLHAEVHGEQAEEDAGEFEESDLVFPLR
jgi:hypothetical protein